MDQDIEDAVEPTAEGAEHDKQLAFGTAVATLTGLATLASVEAGAAATALGPLALAIGSAAISKLGKRRAENAAETIIHAASEASAPVGEFVHKAVDDERRHELFARTMVIAQDTALRDKRRALGRALAAGVMGDEAKIDEELLFLRAVADIDEMHIRLLSRLVSQPRVLGWTVPELTHADPGLFGAVSRLLTTLDQHELVYLRQPGGFYRGPGAEQERYEITGAGREYHFRTCDRVFWRRSRPAPPG